MGYPKPFASNRQGRAVAQYALALVYFQLQKAPQAENLLHKVLEAEPTHEDARLRLGELYYQEKQYKKGIKVLSKLLEHHHLNEKAASILAASYMQLQQFKQADEMYHPGIKGVILPVVVV